MSIDSYKLSVDSIGSETEGIMYNFRSVIGDQALISNTNFLVWYGGIPI